MRQDHHKRYKFPIICYRHFSENDIYRVLYGVSKFFIGYWYCSLSAEEEWRISFKAVFWYEARQMLTTQGIFYVEQCGCKLKCGSVRINQINSIFVSQPPDKTGNKVVLSIITCHRGEAGVLPPFWLWLRRGGAGEGARGFVEGLSTGQGTVDPAVTEQLPSDALSTWWRAPPAISVDQYI